MKIAAQKLPLIVTTSDRDDAALRAKAEAAALDAGVPFVARHHKLPLSKLLAETAESVVVFEADAVTLVDGEGDLRFSPGLAQLRVKQLDAGVTEDMLLRQAELAPGDAVLDCTLGLAADAQVAARCVGPAGSVTALEMSPAVYLLVRYGLETLQRHPAAGELRVLLADAHTFLASLPPRSFDVVLLDPMFERAQKSSVAFSMLRRHASYAPLTSELLTLARRAARKRVVVKGSRYSCDFKKLGLTAEPARPNAKVLWARLPPL